MVPKRGLKEEATVGTSIKVCMGSVLERPGPQTMLGAAQAQGNGEAYEPSMWVQTQLPGVHP